MDYSRLPEDVAEKIATQHLETIPQRIVFSEVCKSWRSAALRGRRRRYSSPVLLISKPATRSQSPHTNGQNHDLFTLSMLSSTAIPPSPHPITLPFIPSATKMSGHRRHREFAAAVDSPSYGGHTSHSFGSKDGWLLRSLPGHCSDEPFHLYLLNPISGAAVPLPSFRPSLSLEYIQKAIISSSPDDNDEEDDGCYVFIMQRHSTHQLAWYNVFGGGQDWKFIENRSVLGHLEDATCFGGKLYVLGNVEGDHRVSVIDYNGDTTTTTTSIGPPIVGTFTLFGTSRKIWPYTWDYHLCEINGQLHVVMVKNSTLSTPPPFKVYKLVVPPDDDDDDNHQHDYWPWARVLSSLDGCAIFVGAHQSFSINPANSPWIRPDTIYFALSYPSVNMIRCYSDYFSGVFHLPSQKLEKFSVLDHNRGWMGPSSFWFLPRHGDLTKLQKKHQEYMQEKACNDGDI